MKIQHKITKLPLKTLLASTAAIAGLSAMSAPVMAQDSAENSAQQEDNIDNDQSENVIVVTARRREEKLLDVPISISTISGDELANQGVLEITEVAQKMPNVTLETSRATNTTLTAFIRGVGQQDPVSGFEAGVGLYVDDVYLNRPQAAVIDIYDVERIEVLRHQGTLYGRNTIGGAIKYVSRKLPNEFEVRLRGTYGSYDQADGVISIAAPITDELRFGLSGARLSRGGFGDNLNLTEYENYNKDVWATRGSLEYHGESVFVRLSGDYIKDNSDPRQGHRLIPGLVSGTPVLDNVYDTRAGLNAVKQEVEAYGGALNIEVDLTEALGFRSITAYREDTSTSPIDFDSLPAADVDVPGRYENDQFSQELQLTYDDGTFAGLLGFYYLDAGSSTVFDVLLATTGALVGLPGLNAQTFGDVSTKTWSVFGDVTWNINDNISVAAGGRYTHDKRHSIVKRATYIGGFSEFFGGAGVPIAQTSDFDGRATYNDFSPRASVSWKPTANHNIYFTYSQGFKGGSFDPRGQTTAAPDLDQNGTVSAEEIFDFMNFGSEEVDSYELGWKASLLDNRLNIALAGFLGDYSDVQIPGSVGVDTDNDGVNDTFTGVTTNAASADINGIELEMSALVGRDFAGDGSIFRVNGSLGYIDAKFNKFIDAFGADVADQRVFQNTPKWTANMTTNLGIPAFDGLLSWITSVSLRSDTSQFEVPSAYLDQDGYVLVDMSLVWNSDDDRWSLGVYGKNIFDKEYKVSGYNFTAPNGAGGLTSTLGLDGTLTAFYGNPAQVFVTAGVKF